MPSRVQLGTCMEVASMTRDDAWDLLSLRCERLGRDEMRVLAWIAERLTIGLAQYGPLALDSDRRNWARERREEALDGLVYAACDALCAEARCDTEPAPPPTSVPDASPTLPSTAPAGLYREVG